MNFLMSIFVAFAIAEAKRGSNINADSSAEGEIEGKVIKPVSSETVNEIDGEQESAVSTSSVTGSAFADFFALLEFLGRTNTENKDLQIQNSGNFDLVQGSSGKVKGDGSSASFLDKDVGFTANEVKAAVDGGKSALELKTGGTSQNKRGTADNSVTISTDAPKADAVVETQTKIQPEEFQAQSNLVLQVDQPYFMPPRRPHRYYPYPYPYRPYWM
eukprot:TRINITY_DN15213_c0_g1_i1.p2 TRINITY_DN15213_c0_g1~~TRINITY_DN15213_c0_g1_i1.p2  ORF type:complete len:216 (-),score=37.34 TRINITY_DN15213_c0_g1_i1:424-1071(-)